MSLPAETMMELMAYADGELDGDATARARIEALLAADDEARRVVSAMGVVGDWVRAGTDLAADRANVDGIADAVMARIAAGESREAAPVVPMRPRAAASSRGRVVAAAVGVLALAAGAMLVLRSNVESEAPKGVAVARPNEPAVIAPLPNAPAASGEAPALTSEVARAEPAGTAADGVDVDQVESPSHQVSVFYLPAVSAAAVNAHASSVVVWIGDDSPAILPSGGH